MSERVYLSVDQSSHGGLQLSIGVERAGGDGYGYRIFGPKYDGGGKTLKRHYLTERDFEKIKTYLKDSPPMTDQAPELLPSREKIAKAISNSLAEWHQPLNADGVYLAADAALAALTARPSDPATTFTDTEWHDALMGSPKARPSDAAVARQEAADKIVIDVFSRYGLCCVWEIRKDIVNGIAALAIPHDEAVRALDRDGAHTAAEAICDYADNNLSMFEACTENDPVGARKIYEAAKCLRDLLAPTPTVASERVSERETEK